ncbi:M56 family metallopeptidase [Novipirellula artificiosorum]|uniref:Regulatory protein BlaR1 n=1 Tax=Novipirellula artificiosorum TaxID=2528016 RepID=A0A5C6DYD7_9BACT|nr:M56 family metallopeptidase [Novipirellula artificiosorum]TWU42453.1 Regulatory protein BlaR1 [Novipirellula artificiosorum]
MIEQLSNAWRDWIVAASWQLALFILLVAGLVFLLKRSSPRLRHGLWILVLVKVFLPPSLSLITGIGQWGIPRVASQVNSTSVMTNWHVHHRDAIETAPLTTFNDTRSEPKPSTKWLALWAVGVVVFWSLVIVRCRLLIRQVLSNPCVDEGPLKVALEKAAIQLGVTQTPDLHLTDTITSPLVFGLLRPRMVLPEPLVANATESELNVTLIHELSHLKRRDIWIGFLQVIAQGLFWFHPLVWWANRQLRDTREEACDETVLRDGGVAPTQYGETMLRVLTSAKAKSLAGASFIGVFERGSNLQNRLEQMMNYELTNRNFGWRSKAILLTAALVLLPMAPRVADTVQGQERTVAKTPHQNSAPQCVKSEPKVGQLNVKASLNQISVTFDREMGAGMSWTGEVPLDRTRKPKWANTRTCVLPVKLERGKFYRIGINSTSFKNFRSVDGVPVVPTTLYFVTEGASKEVIAKAQKPEIIKLAPANGADSVDPDTPSLSVTFNMPMSGGMSWTGGGTDFPTLLKGKSATWSEDKRTCTLPVKLIAGHKYRLGLNSPSFHNFQSESGIALEPVVYEFRTK